MVEIRRERISAEEYIDFLKRTDLGLQYPKERFEERIAKLVRNVSISLTAREDGGKLIGVCFGITDFAYWLFLTDLGIDRAYVGQGIGRRLTETALLCAGGEKNIIMYTCANEKAIPFYEKIGMTAAVDVMEYNRIEWTSFRVE
ncbi:MAG: GNAT family N-acetyltransferase [Lachnospiraceae bacterium]|nr:GNAT family N-acetyltransferase [Lachnospiraceae bacterium]